MKWQLGRGGGATRQGRVSEEGEERGEGKGTVGSVGVAGTRLASRGDASITSVTSSSPPGKSSRSVEHSTNAKLETDTEMFLVAQP